MPLKTPSFWRQDGLLATLLSPLSCLYFFGHKLKQAVAAPAYDSSIPVLCVGGIVAGGSGKTPTLHAILDIIHREKIFQNPVILTRGYGGGIKTATCVNLALHSVSDVGDEALLHAARAATIISRHRADGARLAESMGADIILMDDGLQNQSLKKNASILVVNAHQGLGNRKLLPAGPLREPFEDALSKVQLVVIVGDEELSIPPVIQTRAKIAPLNPIDTARTYHAFAGLGDPEKFRRTLIQSGARLSGFTPFADHHAYNANDILSLRQDAGSSTLITTEKDFVRIPTESRHLIETLPIQIVFDDETALLKILRSLQ